MYVCLSTSNRPYVHLGFRVPNSCRVPKWLSTKMAVISYIRLGYVPRTASNGRIFKQNTLEAPNHPTKIEAAKERILATTLPPNSKISQDLKEVYSPQSHIHSCSLPLFPFCIQLICSSHSLSYTICTCYTLFSSCGLWSITPNPAIMQPSIHFPLFSI